jgi:hypothetical protein
MSDFSTNLQLPYLMPAQAQKHVTVNEALRRMDALVQMRAQSRGVMAQPASPGDGDLWILPAGKTGADWDGFTEGRVAYYRDGAWEEIAPRVGWFAFVVDEDQLLVFTAAGWTSAVAAAGALLESECANPAGLKAIDQGLATGSAGVSFESLGVGGAPAFKFDVHQAADTLGARLRASHASFSNDVAALLASRAADSAFGFLRCYSDGAGAADTEFLLRGDGNGFCDGGWTGGGADYAEYFEWSDGNPDNEDRRGFPVVIVPGSTGKIRIAAPDDDPAGIIGAVSANPIFVGDAAWNAWIGKYLRDDFGACVMEDYAAATWLEPPAEEGGEPVVRSCALDTLPEGAAPPAGAAIVTQRRRVLNPGHDPHTVYIPRAERKEWDAVGLMGKLRIRTGQPVGDRWLKLRDIAPAVEEWLVR